MKPKLCVKRTRENAKEINKFLNSLSDDYGYNYCPLDDDYDYVHSYIVDKNSELCPHTITGNKEKSKVSGYTEVSLEQFKSIFIEEKQLLGYKIKPEFESKRKEIANAFGFELGIDHSDGCFFRSEHYINKAKELGVLSLWFDEVFEEDEYKAGDYVIVKSAKQCGRGNGILTDNALCLVVDFSMRNKATGNASNKECKYIVQPTYEDYYYGIHEDDVIRKATPDEIEKASKIFICGKEVKFFHNGIEVDGCFYSLGYISKVKEVLQALNIKYLAVGCNEEKITLSLIDKILKKLN